MVNRCFFIFSILLFAYNYCGAQVAADYAVQLTTTVQQSPPQIKISWPAKTGISSYVIYRKAKTATSWGSALATLTGADSTYTDATVVTDSAYEYFVAQMGSIVATSYVYAGIKAPAIHNRGTLLLLVDSTFTDSCATQIKQLMQDINGDGWAVIRHDISRSTPDTTIHALIVTDYNSKPNVAAVLILGHLAVPYSGDLNPDGHPNHLGAWPADVYYGDINGHWSDNTVNDTSSAYAANQNRIGDGKWDQTIEASPVELEVGRVDFYNMPVFGKTEVQLMSSYLTRDHLFKMDSLDIKHRALIDDNFGAFGGEAFAANGWRNFPQLVGADNIKAIDFISSLNDSSYIWAYGCGGGSFNSAGGIGTTNDFAANHTNGIFTMLFGSYFGDWNVQNNFLRAPLCSDIPALTSCWAGRPNWYFHHMALGENIGYAAKISQNNAGLYGPSSYGEEFVHVALMGDPSLRMDYIIPPHNLIAISAGADAGANISWGISPDTAVIGYYVYRSDTAYGNYMKISGLLTTNSFVDTIGNNGLKYYMVRPVKLQQTPSGYYYNLGIGITDTATITYPTGVYMPASSVNDVQLYPNPAHNYLNISINSNQNAVANLYIIDVNGRKVLTTMQQLAYGKNNYSIDVSKLPAGLYTVTICTGKTTETRKWIKIN